MCHQKSLDTHHPSLDHPSIDTRYRWVSDLEDIEDILDTQVFCLLYLRVLDTEAAGAVRAPAALVLDTSIQMMDEGCQAKSAFVELTFPQMVVFTLLRTIAVFDGLYPRMVRWQ